LLFNPTNSVTREGKMEVYITNVSVTACANSSPNVINEIKNAIGFANKFAEENLAFRLNVLQYTTLEKEDQSTPDNKDCNSTDRGELNAFLEGVKTKNMANGMLYMFITTFDNEDHAKRKGKVDETESPILLAVHKDEIIGKNILKSVLT
ncbi:hypothetical protein MHBO_004765, partial [Bonamia ostreae]